MKESNLSWPAISDGVRAIANMISRAGSEYDLVVSLNRGGLIAGVMLSHIMGVRHAVMSIESYSGKKRSRIRSGHGLSMVGHIPRKGLIRVLLVDDIADSGKSLEFAIEKIVEELEQLGHKGAVGIETAVLVYKPKSIITPTYIGVDVKNDVWINFPWEVDNSGKKRVACRHSQKN